MRVALIGRRFDPAGGGTERDLVITARILGRAGHEVAIYADDIRNESREWRPRRVDAIPLGRALRLWSFARRAGSMARDLGAEVVLSFARIADADVLRSGGAAHSSYLQSATRWRGSAGAVAMRLSPYHRIQIAVERRGFASSRLKCAIAVSALVRRDLIRTFALDPSRVVTLYNGVDLERFRPEPDRAVRSQIRRDLDISERAPTAVFVGNGFARKGLRFLLEAWPALGTDAHLIVAGADRHTNSFRRLATRLGVAGRAHFVGPQERIEHLFAAADALVLPSLFEPFGNVVMEAMAAGLPVLCSAACGVMETLPAEFGHFVVADPTDRRELAMRLAAVLQVRGDLTRVARTTAEQFTWDRYGAGLLDLLRRL
jgi:UDP-glucose:(heptosyl)LPS alpha-1,3-glucosyltransferase